MVGRIQIYGGPACRGGVGGGGTAVIPPSRKRPPTPHGWPAHHIAGGLFKQTGPLALLLRDLFVWTVYTEIDIDDPLLVQTTH